MNQQQIELVQHTFAKIEPIAQDVGEMFYNRLFEMDPSLQPLFKGDMRQQAKMMMTAIGMAVKSLNAPDSVIPDIQQIGHRHISYGAMPTDFDKFGAALLWSLEQTLGPDFTPPVKEAWIETFQFIVKGMKIATR